MSARMKVAALVALSATQVGAAGWSIARYESTLRSGAIYRIRTVPVDPADAFRGRYVAVRPAMTVTSPAASETKELLARIQGGETGYVLLTTDADGFAAVAQVLAEPPAQGDYLQIRHVRERWDQGGRARAAAQLAGYTIDFPFDRYYMNEAAAPQAEERYAYAMRRNAAAEAWLTVRVKDGVGVIEGLFVDGVPIEELVVASPKQ